MKSTQRSLLFIIFTTGLASAISLIGGIGLEHVSDRILPLIPLLIAIPSLNDLVGDYSTIIAAHTGDTTERKRSHRDLSRAIFRVVGFNIAAIVVLSLIVAASRGYVLHFYFLVRFVYFVIVAVIAVILAMFTINRVLDRILINHRLSPDDLLIPISTALADIMMLVLITLAVLFLF